MMEHHRLPKRNIISFASPSRVYGKKLISNGSPPSFMPIVVIAITLPGLVPLAMSMDSIMDTMNEVVDTFDH